MEGLLELTCLYFKTLKQSTPDKYVICFRCILSIIWKNTNGKYVIYEDHDPAELFGDMLNDLSEGIQDKNANLNLIKEYYELQTTLKNVCRG